MIDLHMHTKYSDGSNTVEEIFKIAKSVGLDTIAITDHDILSAMEESHKYEKLFGIKNIPAVEISTRYKDNRELHILAYLIDYKNKDFVEMLNWIRKTRKERNINLIKLLNSLGYEFTLEELIEVAEKESNIGRPHFARLLIEKGYFKSFDQVFTKLLAEGKPGYIERESISPYKAIEMIHKAGGVAVLAHPLSYRFENKSEVKSLILDLVDHGIDGLEAEYVTYKRSDIDWIKRIAKSLDLIITGGSDFHGKYKPHISLGKGLGSLYVPDKFIDSLYERQILNNKKD